MVFPEFGKGILFFNIDCIIYVMYDDVKRNGEGKLESLILVVDNFGVLKQMLSKNKCSL